MLRGKKRNCVLSYFKSIVEYSVKFCLLRSPLCLQSAEAGRAPQLSASVMTILLRRMQRTRTNVQVSGGAEKAMASRASLSELKALEGKVEETSSS